MNLYMLTAEVNDTFGSIYNGITTLHLTESGAINRLENWLYENCIDHTAAWSGAIRTGTSIANDPDPDLNNGAEIHWGINLIEVQD